MTSAEPPNDPDAAPDAANAALPEAATAKPRATLRAKFASGEGERRPLGAGDLATPAGAAPQTIPSNAPAGGPDQLLCAAIARRSCVMVTYNREALLLAPHILFTKHDELYLRAVTVERAGKPARYPKLGTFKLIGLSDVTLTSQKFANDPSYAPDDPEFVGNTISAVAR